jgi:hypothetical protein
VRTGVVLAGGSLVVGCRARSSGVHPTDGVSDAAGDDPDVPLLTAAIQDETNLSALARATVRQHPTQAAAMQPVLTSQRAHVRELTAALSEKPQISRGGSPSVPANPVKAVAALRDAISAAESARLDDCLAASSGLLARLLASVSASHATMVERLRRDL